MNSRFQFLLRSLRSKLWIKPLGYAILAFGLVLAARLVDQLGLDGSVPEINRSTIEKLLNVISTSMLGVATFAVASMVSAYASASRSATPRVFTLIVADSMSQKALSTFIAAFIFSVVATVALESKYYGSASRFALFLMTILVVAWVIVMFVRWVDHIARLGRMHNTIERVEEATIEALQAWGPSRSLGATPTDGPQADKPKAEGEPVYTQEVGYVQHLDVHALHEYGETIKACFNVTAPPGTFISPSRALLHVVWDEGSPREFDAEEIQGHFILSNTRTFTQDPRFGLIALAEIASRALSPGVNDPGTAIEVIGRFVRIVSDWKFKVLDDEGREDDSRYTRVRGPTLSYDDMMDDAFHAIARDGADNIEVSVWVQKGLAAIAELDHRGLSEAARSQAKLALQRAKQSLTFENDLERLEATAKDLWD